MTPDGTTTTYAADPAERSRPYEATSWAGWVVAHAAGVLFWTALAAGALLRIVRYVDNNSLWLDESYLALNLLDTSARQLLDALDFAQSAPPGFLLAEKGMIELLGDSERSLRLLPFVASILALGLFAWIARRLLSPWAATLAVALFAMNDLLVFHASETKPYSIDVAVSVALLALVIQFTRGPATFTRVVPLLVMGTLAPFLSFPSVLVLAGAGLAALVVLYQDGSRRDFVVTAVLMGAWIASFSVVLALSSDTIRRVSSDIFAGQPSTGQGLSNAIELSWSLFFDPGNFTDGTNALAALLAAFGFVEFARRSRAWLVVALGTPAVLAFAAAVLERYPLGSRYSLFLVPIMVLLVARGVDALVHDSRRAALLATALAIVLLAPQGATAIRHAASPPRPEDVRPLLRAAANGWRKGDALYVYRNAQYAVRYYGTCDDCRPGGTAWPWEIRRAPSSGTGEQFAPALESVPPTIIVGTQEPIEDRVAADVGRLPRTGRIWLLFSHVSKHDGLDEGALLKRELDSRGRLVRAWSSGTADLLLYRLTG